MKFLEKLLSRACVIFDSCDLPSLTLCTFANKVRVDFLHRRGKRIFQSSDASTGNKYTASQERRDNFDPENAMVIPSLINRASSGERPLTVWGDGSPIRDFIYSDDVADGMIEVVKRGYNKPINLGSGSGVTIKEIAIFKTTAITKNLNNK